MDHTFYTTLFLFLPVLFFLDCVPSLHELVGPIPFFDPETFIVHKDPQMFKQSDEQFMVAYT